MAKRAKELEITERRIYKPESEQCSACGEEIKLHRYYQWDKIVQQMSGTIHVASRGGICVNVDCSQVNEVVRSSAAESVSLLGCTYRLDVIAQIGWWRDKDHQDRGEIHSRLINRGVQLSERQVDYLYNRYQVLLACVGNQDKSRLQEVHQTYGGLKVSLDGLSPEGASEQLWVVREVESQITLVVAWLDTANPAATGRGVGHAYLGHDKRQAALPAQSARAVVACDPSPMVPAALSRQYSRPSL